MPRRAPVRRGVRAGGCAGAVRGPLCQGNMRALLLAVPLPGEAGPARGGLRPQGGPGEGEHRGAAAGRGHRGVAQAVCHKGRDRGDKLRAEARPRAWARGCEGAVGCGLPSTSRRWRATSSGWSMHAWWRWRTRLSRRPGRYPRSQPREGPAPQLPSGALSHGRVLQRDHACPEGSPEGRGGQQLAARCASLPDTLTCQGPSQTGLSTKESTFGSPSRRRSLYFAQAPSVRRSCTTPGGAGGLQSYSTGP